MVKYFVKLNRFLESKFENSMEFLFPCCLVGSIGFPLFFLIYFETERLWLDMLGTAVSVAPLIARRYSFLRDTCLASLWFLFLLVALPFNFSYNFFVTPENVSYQLGFMIMLIILTVSVSDLALLLLVLFLGISLAIIVVDEPFFILVRHTDLIETGPMYLLGFALSIGLMRKKDAIEKMKLKGVLSLAHCMAHELGTPLMSLKLNIASLKRILPKLLPAFSEKEDDKSMQSVSPSVLRRLPSVLNNMEQDIHSATSVTRILLINAEEGRHNKLKYEKNSMYDCIKEALRTYPYPTGFTRRIVDWRLSSDFDFYGDKQLMVHVFLNLLKNAIRAIAESRKGNIVIWNERKGQFNYLYFKDTALGVSKEALRRLFSSFFSTYKEGTGLGLYFCKNTLESFSGEINCRSVEGEYMMFILKLPVIRA